eukprot:tig00021119_g18426.t1
MEGVKGEPGTMKICGIDLAPLPRNLQFLICAGGVFAVYQLHALAQEFLFRSEQWTYSWFVTFFAFAVGFCISSFERMRAGDSVKSFTAPVLWFVVIGALLLTSMGFSNLALTYVNLPTQVVFKSAKVIPVMIAGYFVLGKTYSWLEYVSAILFFCGLSMFTLGDVTVTPNFNWLGVLSLLFALCADAFIGNAQEKLLRLHRVPLTELVQGSYLFGMLLCLGLCVVNGELLGALRACSANPQIWGLLTLAALAGYLGTYFVLMLVNGFGAVTAVVVTSCRKLITIMLSFVLFPKPFTWLYLWGTLVLFAGVLVNTYAKNHGHHGHAGAGAGAGHAHGRGSGGPHGTPPAEAHRPRAALGMRSPKRDPHAGTDPSDERV